MSGKLTQDNRLLKKGFMKALFPVMFSVLGATINALIDSVFVSQRLGESALASVNLSMPVYLVLCTIGSLISGGASVCSASAAGRDNMKSAVSYYRTAFVLSVGVSAVITVLGVIFCRPVSEMLAAGGGLADQVYQYCLVTFIGSAVSVFIYIPFCYLQLEGKNKDITVTVTIMVSADFVLDILFMYVFDFGLYGASAASVVSAFAAMIYGFIKLSGKDSDYRIGAVKIKPRYIGNILKYGSTAALGNLFDAVKLLLLNMIIISAVGDKGSAIWAALNSLSELSLLIVLGVPKTAAPMISSYNAAMENSGIRMLTRIEVIAGFLFSSAFTILTSAFYRPIGSMFGLSGSFLLPVICLGISVILSTLCGIWEKHFNATGFIMEANILSAMKSCVFPVTAALLLSSKGDEIWFFLPLSAFFSLVLTAAMIWIRYMKARKTPTPLSPLLLLDDHLEREHKILDFSINADMNEVCDAAERIKDFCTDNDMSMKMAIKLGLSIEELLNVVIAKTPNIESVDLRAFAIRGSTGLRIRCPGKRYDPFSDKESDEDFLMGINMLYKLADTTSHQYTFGMNIIAIVFRYEKG